VANAREALKQDEAERLRLQKTHDRELKMAATAHKKRQAEAAKVARQHAAEERPKAKKARGEELLGVVIGNSFCFTLQENGGEWLCITTLGRW
jgi:hypothetical protein